MTMSRVEVAVECDTWAVTAPSGQRVADVIERPTVLSARRIASVLAGEHGPQCLIAIRETGDDRGWRVVEELRGEREECRQTERKFVEAMLARGGDRAEIRDRIAWARGHGLMADDMADALEQEAARGPDGVR
jgi:hypothetical protein